MITGASRSASDVAVPTFEEAERAELDDLPAWLELGAVRYDAA
ncbi:MAG TPA: hypothetical protein VFN99_01840 [Gaiella sp.]|nr:hypothetical protein [Gaiella sp.]